MKHCSLSSALHNPSTSVSDIGYPSRNPQVSLRIVGIANGLVCLAIGRNELYLWNPNLRKSKHLPGSNFSLKYVVYGFGYNESNDDYKVVIVCETKVEVYSVRADSWRRIEDINDGVPYCDETYANGKIWWKAVWTTGRISASGRNSNIVSLDMVSDTYEEVQGPVHETGACIGVITELGGRLYVVCHYFKRKADLWVMDKFGVEESWSKVVSVSFNDVHPANPIGMIQVLCISRNGKIVFVDRSGGLLLFRFKDKEIRKIQLGGLRSFSEVFVYAESLVSPNGL